jgi:co-chaperonin GroES (HSP10)
VGMQVMFNKFGAMPIKLEEKEYLLIDEDKILGYYE